MTIYIGVKSMVHKDDKSCNMHNIVVSTIR